MSPPPLSFYSKGIIIKLTMHEQCNTSLLWDEMNSSDLAGHGNPGDVSPVY